jgi:hypothetical protein
MLTDGQREAIRYAALAAQEFREAAETLHDFVLSVRRDDDDEWRDIAPTARAYAEGLVDRALIDIRDALLPTSPRGPHRAGPGGGYTLPDRYTTPGGAGYDVYRPVDARVQGQIESGIFFDKRNAIVAAPSGTWRVFAGGALRGEYDTHFAAADGLVAVLDAGASAPDGTAVS